MSLATRCPACSTTFRVVQDQLKVSDGWVRCGQCQEVFNALEALFELPAAPVAPAATSQGATRSPALPTPDSFTHIDLGEPPPPPPLGEQAWPADAAVDAAQALGSSPPDSAPAPDDVAARGDDGPRDARAEAAGNSPASPVAPRNSAPVQDGLPAVAMATSSQSTFSAAAPDVDTAPVGASRPDAAPATHPVLAMPGRGVDTDETSPRDNAVAPPGERPGDLPLPGATAADSALHAELPNDTREQRPSAPEPGAVSDSDASSAPAWTMSPETRWERKRRRRPRPTAAPRRDASPDAPTSAAAPTAPVAPTAPAASTAIATPATAPRSRRRKPEFMRRVERAAHWQRPAVRAVLGSAAAVLLLLLCGQVGLAFRDELAARWPVLAAPLDQACRPLGCEVAAPRSLEHLVIDSSQLSRTAWPETLRLTAELRNTASHAVRAPALELRFTDPSGRTLVRKVLLPAELAASAASAPLAIGADDSWQVDALLAVGPLQVSGFSAEVFYP